MDEPKTMTGVYRMLNHLYPGTRYTAWVTRESPRRHVSMRLTATASTIEVAADSWLVAISQLPRAGTSRFSKASVAVALQRRADLVQREFPGLDVHRGEAQVVLKAPEDWGASGNLVRSRAVAYGELNALEWLAQELGLDVDFDEHRFEHEVQ